MSKIIKEIIIILLVCLVSMLVMAIVLYKYIPTRKVVPEVVTYTASEEVQDLLEDNIDNKSDADNVILTYELTASDLKGYQSTNTYVPGKSNPFAVSASSSSSDTSSGDSTNSDNNSSNSNGSDNNKKDETTNSEQKNPNQAEESTAPSVYNKNGTK